MWKRSHSAPFSSCLFVHCRGSATLKYISEAAAVLADCLHKKLARVHVSRHGNDGKDAIGEFCIRGNNEPKWKLIKKNPKPLHVIMFPDHFLQRGTRSVWEFTTTPLKLIEGNNQIVKLSGERTARAENNAQCYHPIERLRRSMRLLVWHVSVARQALYLSGQRKNENMSPTSRSLLHTLPPGQGAPSLMKACKVPIFIYLLFHLPAPQGTALRQHIYLPVSLEQNGKQWSGFIYPTLMAFA